MSDTPLTVFRPRPTAEQELQRTRTANNVIDAAYRQADRTGKNTERYRLDGALAVYAALSGISWGSALALAEARVADEIYATAEASGPAACECITSCADVPATACSLSGEPHVHPETGRCPAHPAAPGDWPTEDIAAARAATALTLAPTARIILAAIRGGRAEVREREDSGRVLEVKIGGRARRAVLWSVVDELTDAGLVTQIAGAPPAVALTPLAVRLLAAAPVEAGAVPAYRDSANHGQ